METQMSDIPAFVQFAEIELRSLADVPEASQQQGPL